MPAIHALATVSDVMRRACNDVGLFQLTRAATGTRRRRRQQRQCRHKTKDDATIISSTVSPSHSQTGPRPPSQTDTRPSSETTLLSRLKSLTSADVSRPCHPRWITRVDAADTNFRSAFADFLPVPPAAGVVAASDSEFRPRLPTN